MIKRPNRWLWGTGLIGWLIAAPAGANCSDPVAALEWYEPVMIEHFQQLQSQSSYPWGNARILDRLEGPQIFLTDAFESLSGPQKTQALTTVIQASFRTYLTAEEFAQKFSEPGYGDSPYQAIASDGRLLSAAYDGCTRFNLLTEMDRFSWYYNNQGRYLPENLSQSDLRNVGQPSWRKVNFPIAANAEQAVRLGFWRSVGYASANWWIAWVPEQGYFEVNVPENFDYQRLQRYWQVADRSYRYVVVRADGTRLGEKRFR
jgi:hypothetical protein